MLGLGCEVKSERLVYLLFSNLYLWSKAYAAVWSLGTDLQSLRMPDAKCLPENTLGCWAEFFEATAKG